MNAIAFATKRAFHGFLRVTRRPLASMGLTAARFDVLAVLYKRRDFEGTSYGVFQSEIHRALGVTAPVVTRMLQALEAFGWVIRRRVESDRRQLWVKLTRDGMARIGAIYRVMTRAVLRWVYDAVCSGHLRRSDERWIDMEAIESYLRALRREFGDVATLTYPWDHPDG
jgi:DNA-binding MarR family transcriptional regulator